MQQLFWLKIQFFDESRVNEWSLFLVVELLPGGVGLVPQSDHLVDFGQHGHDVLRLVVSKQNSAENLQKDMINQKRSGYGAGEPE